MERYTTDIYTVSVDAGGTKTKACVYDRAGNLICSKTTDFGNLSLDYDMAQEHIIKAINLCTECMDGKLAFICVGAAGIETGTYKARLKAELESLYHVPAVTVSDAVLALYSALEGKDGVLVISGTGSIASCKWKGDISRVGGWGHLINDDGSGYSIGQQAIRRIMDNNDCDRPGTPLELGIFAHLNINNLRDLTQFVYSHQKSDIAALLPVVERLAENGDEQAADILIWAGEQLAGLVFKITRRYGITEPLISISGSAITKTRMVRTAFEQAIASRFSKYEISMIKNDPAKGGYYIWREQAAR